MVGKNIIFLFAVQWSVYWSYTKKLSLCHKLWFFNLCNPMLYQLRFFKLWILLNPSWKHKKFTTSGCKDIGSRKIVTVCCRDSTHLCTKTKQKQYKQIIQLFLNMYYLLVTIFSNNMMYSPRKYKELMKGLVEVFNKYFLFDILGQLQNWLFIALPLEISRYL